MLEHTRFNLYQKFKENDSINPQKNGPTQKKLDSEFKSNFVSEALGGNLSNLQYLQLEGCLLYSDTCSNSAKNGNLDCLKYHHEN